MAKLFHDDVLDAALDKLATCTHLTFCSSQPANYAGIAAVALAAATLTAGDGNGDYVIADDTSGRKLTVGAQTGMTPSANGTVTYAVLDDGTTLLNATTVTSQAVTTAQTWNSPAFKLAIADPV
ncbi:MAG: hypothetical protein AB9866_19040 [Syntrophobacteraceae bacterium]